MQSEIGLAGNPLKLIWIDEPSQVPTQQPPNQPSSQDVPIQGDNDRTWTPFASSSPQVLRPCFLTCFVIIGTMVIVIGLRE